MNRTAAILIGILTAVGFSAHHGWAAERATRASGENRFLFIIETSITTKRISTEIQDAVLGLVNSEMVGQIKAGDSYSIWTYNETLNAGQFGAQRWVPETRKLTVEKVREYLKKIPFEKNARFEAVKPALASVTKASPKLTVFLITDGKQPVEGFKFDEEINGLFHDNYQAMRSARMPFITIAVARSGDYLGYTVNSTLGKIQYPHPPARPAATPETAVNQPVPQVVAPPPAVVVPVPAPDPAPVPAAPPPTAATVAPVATETAVIPVVPAPVPRPTAAAAPADNPVAIPVETATTNPTPPVTPMPLPTAPPPSAVSPRVLPTPVSAAPNEPVASIPVATNPPVRPSAPAPSLPASVTPAAGEPARLKPSPPPVPTDPLAVVQVTETTTGRRALLVTGVALAVVAAFLAYILLRPRRDASLISRSMRPPPG